MKNLLSLLFITVFAVSSFSQVTNMNIHKTDGSTTSFDIAEVDSVTYTTTTPPSGGTFASPITVTDAIANNVGNLVWVQGFIVGVIETGGTDNLASLTAPFSTNSNVYIAPSAAETDTNNMLIVQLPSGAVRTATNLVDNGSVLGLEIKYRGNLQAYFGVAGLKSTDGYWFIASDTGVDPDYVAPGTIWSENFSDILNPYDPITSMTVIMQEGTKDWHGDGYNGKSAEASAYQSAEAVNKIWLITPALDLTGATAPKLTFSSALKYHTGDILSVFICTDFDGSDPTTATWAPLAANIVDNTDPVDAPSGMNFTTSGDVDLSAYTSSSTVYIAWFYNGSGTSGQTTKYRIDDILIAE